MASIYFYGHTNGKPFPYFSNFYPVPGGFEYCGVTLPTSEHHLMYQKDLLMGDGATALEIKKATKPLHAKRLGRKVKPWDQAKWEANCSDIMEKILVAKFSHPAMKSLLLDTGDVAIYEAAPRDKVWGIGIGVEAGERGEAHRGRNLLGKALVRAREVVRAAGADVA